MIEVEAARLESWRKQALKRSVGEGCRTESLAGSEGKDAWKAEKGGKAKKEFYFFYNSVIAIALYPFISPINRNPLKLR